MSHNGEAAHRAARVRVSRRDTAGPMSHNGEAAHRAARVRVSRMTVAAAR